MENKVFTMQEIWEASKPNIEKNKKKYFRKEKHNRKKNNYLDE